MLDGVRDPIDRLHKLSTRIRNPSTRLWSSKAQRHQQINEETGIDFLQVVEKFDYHYVCSVSLQYQEDKALKENTTVEPATTNNGDDDDDDVWEPLHTMRAQYEADIRNGTAESFLVQRIARASVRRRQQFSYWKKHREKLRRHLPTSTLHTEGPQDIPDQTIPVGPERLPSDDFTSMVIPPAHSTTLSCLNSAV